MPRVGSTMVKVALLAVVAAAALQAQNRSGSADSPASKPRIVFTNDPELDDSNTIVRALLYSTDYTIEGLIYASSQYHWKGDGKGTKWFVAGREYTRYGLNLCPCTSWRWAEDERFIDDAVDAYEKAYPNLRVHNPDYPAPEYLRSKIRYGNIEFDGEMSKDTPGSDLIRSLILDDKPGPLYIEVGGGASTVARALKSIQDQYEGTVEWAPLQERISEKVVLLLSGDQDNTDARYIRPNWPSIPHGISGGWRGVPLAYSAQRRLSGDDAEYYSAEWQQESISSRGPLGAFWRVWGDGKQMVKGDIFDYFGLSGLTAEQLTEKGYVVWLAPGEKGSFLGEGDSGTFMALLGAGLRMTVNAGAVAPGAGPGGFGAAGAGPGAPGTARGAVAGAPGAPQAGGRSGTAPAAGRSGPNFIPAVWRDFAARMKWAVTPSFKDANHRPGVKVQGPLDVTARPGATVELSAVTSDPDNSQVSVKWWQYNSPGTYPGEIAIASPTALETSFQVPADAEPGATIHVVVEAIDNGSPPLTHYQHMVISVEK